MNLILKILLLILEKLRNHNIAINCWSYYIWGFFLLIQEFGLLYVKDLNASAFQIFIDSDFCHFYLHTLYLFECL